MSLTRGALAKIYAGEEPDEVNEPNLQVLGYKRLAGQERYRILLSDAINSNSFSMLSTQLNPMIHDKQLEPFSIIKVDQYICNQVQGQSNRVLILLEVSVVTPGDQVNQKLGNPMAMWMPMERFPVPRPVPRGERVKFPIPHPDTGNVLPAHLWPMEGELNLPKFTPKVDLNKSSDADITHLEETMKQINIKEKFKADIKEIEEKRNATKIDIEKAKKDFTTTLGKLENTDDVYVMPNVRKDMECPMCLEEMKPPTRIYQCTFGHLICGGCHGFKVFMCPTCKEADFIGRAWATERLARTLYGQP